MAAFRRGANRKRQYSRTIQCRQRVLAAVLTKICAFAWEPVRDRDQCAKKLALASGIIPLLGYALLIFLYANGAAVPRE